MDIKVIELDDWDTNPPVAPQALASLPFAIEDVNRRLELKLTSTVIDGLGECKECALQIDGKKIYIFGSLANPPEDSLVRIQGTEKEPMVILNNICKLFVIQRSDLAWVMDFLNGPEFKVVRLDDNGNEVEMERFYIEASAVAYAKEFESRGHNQSYFVRPAR